MQSAEKTFVLPDVCVKRIDYILVYPVKDIQKENGQTNVKKRQEQRQSFIAALLEEGVIIQKDINANEILLKLHVPFQKLCEEAERIKLEMPLAGVSNYCSPSPYVVHEYSRGRQALITPPPMEYNHS